MAQVDFTNIKGNSFKEREENKERERKEKVVTGLVTPSKRSRLRSSFFSTDRKSIGEYLIFDVIIPSAKDLISSMVTKGINMLLFGSEGRQSNKPTVFGTASYVNYNAISTGRSNQTQRSSSRVYSDDLLFSERSDAEEVLNQMCDAIEAYGVVTVFDMYDLAGLPVEHTDNKYGWKNLASATVVRTRDGYLLKLPTPKPINN